MTTCRVFLDSNVLVYTMSRGIDETKRLTTLGVLRALLGRGTGVISPQVIGEFVSVCSRRSFPWASAAEALERARGFVEEFEIAPLDASTTAHAIRIAYRYQIHFYDAQIWAAARMSGCDYLLTEDTHGDEIEGVRYMNPFAPGFDIEALLGG